MATKREIENLRLRSSDDLCELAETLGYRGAVDQLQCRNGAYVSSLLAFFDDNPGAMWEVLEWVLENSPEVEDEEDEEEEDEEESDGGSGSAT